MKNKIKNKKINERIQIHIIFIVYDYFSTLLSDLPTYVFQNLINFMKTSLPEVLFVTMLARGGGVPGPQPARVWLGWLRPLLREHGLARERITRERIGP